MVWRRREAGRDRRTSNDSRFTRLTRSDGRSISSDASLVLRGDDENELLPDSDLRNEPVPDLRNGAVPDVRNKSELGSTETGEARGDTMPGAMAEAGLTGMAGRGTSFAGVTGVTPVAKRRTVPFRELPGELAGVLSLVPISVEGLPKFGASALSLSGIGSGAPTGAAADGATDSTRLSGMIGASPTATESLDAPQPISALQPQLAVAFACSKSVEIGGDSGLRKRSVLLEHEKCMCFSNMKKVCASTVDNL